MQNLLNDLRQLLKQDDRLMVEDELLKNKIIELALKLDENLIRLLLSHSRLRQHFFADIDGVLVFDKQKFLQFVSNKAFLPDSYTAFKNKIGLTDDGGTTYLSRHREVVLAWPYKDCVLEGGQTEEDAKRDEVFWNETLAPDDIDRLLDPKVLTNFRRIDANGEHPVTEIADTDNLIIKGNNLLALHTLTRRFGGKVKLIYIDPPYNTGGTTDTFTYNNSFDHSTWLTFVKNRVEISKHLLRDDGFIAVTIDHVELYYLGVLLDEVFDRENRVGIVTILINPKGRQHERFFSAATEYMLVYAKNKSVARFNKVTLDESVAKSFNLSDQHGKYRLESFVRARSSTLRKNKPGSWYPIYVSKDLKNISLVKKTGYHEVFPIKNGQEFTWKTNSKTFAQRNAKGMFVAQDEGGKVNIYHKYYEQQVLKNIWTDKKYFPEFQGTNLLKKLLGESLFSYPKSLYAVLDTLKIMTSNDDLVLDFFAGSGTTGHATLELNKRDGGDRKFILIEQLDEHIDICIKRIQRVLDEHSEQNLLFNTEHPIDFVYVELAKWNEKWVERIKKVKTKEDLKQVWDDMKGGAFLSYRLDAAAFDDHATEFTDLTLEDQKRFLLEVLDKNQLYVNLSEIDDAEYQVSEEDKRLNRQFYNTEQN